MPRKYSRKIGATKHRQWQERKSEGEINHTLKADLKQGMQKTKKWRTIQTTLERNIKGLKRAEEAIQRHPTLVKQSTRLMIEINSLFSQMRLLYLQHLMTGHQPDSKSEYMDKIKSMSMHYEQKMRQLEKLALEGKI